MIRKVFDLKIKAVVALLLLEHIAELLLLIHVVELLVLLLAHHTEVSHLRHHHIRILLVDIHVTHHLIYVLLLRRLITSLQLVHCGPLFFRLGLSQPVQVDVDPTDARPRRPQLLVASGNRCRGFVSELHDVALSGWRCVLLHHHQVRLL